MNIPLTPIRFLRYAEQQFPRRTAIVCGDQRFSYAQFADRARRLAGALRASGIGPGDRVAFLSANCHRLLEAYYGVIEAGAVLLPLNIRLAPQELAYILNDAGASALFVETQFLKVAESFHSAVPTVRTFYLLDGAPQEDWLSPLNYESLLSGSAPFRAEVMDVDEDALAELFYTSGTSAKPKGVMLTHRNVYLHAVDFMLTLLLERDPVYLHTIPLFHANAWGAPHFITLAGGKHVMLHHFNPAEAFRLIEQEKVSYCSVVPAMGTALVNSPEIGKRDLSSLKRIMIGGAASSPTLVREMEEKLDCICHSGYGLTETAPVLSLSPLKAGMNFTGEQRWAVQAMTGYAVPGTELLVVGPNDEDVPRDGKTIGEVVARSDSSMEGYWRQPEATAEALRGGWVRTGDMAVWNEDGYLLIVDRKKDIIVSGGENVSSLELESAILAHPSVLEVAVIPVPDEKWGEVPLAIVVAKSGTHLTESEVIEFCRSRLAHYKCPRSVEFLESLPRTGTGKVLKRELRKKYWQGRETLRPGFTGPGNKGPAA